MNKVAKNYLYNLIYKILTILIPLVTTPYVSRALGAEQLGNYSYTYSTVTFIILLGTLGSQLYTQRGIAYNRNDKQKESQFFWEVLFLRLLTVTISLIPLYFIAYHDTENRILILVESIEIYAAAIDVCWLFQGEEDFAKPVLRNIAVKITGIILIFCLVKTSQDLVLYALIKSGTVLIGNMYVWKYVFKYIQWLPGAALHPFKHLKGMFSMFLPQMAIQVYSVLDKTLLKFLGGNLNENGYYDQAYKIVLMSLSFAGALNAAMIPRLAYLFKNGDKTLVDDGVRLSIKISLACSLPISLGLLAVSDNLVPWFFGPGYEKVSFLIKLFTIAIFLSSITGVCNQQYMVTTSKEKYYTLSSVLAAAVSIVVNCLLMPRYLSVGAVIGNICAEITIYIVLRICMGHILNLKFIFVSSKNYWIAGLIMYAVVALAATQLNPSIINTGILVLTGAFIYFIILYIMKDSLIILGLSHLKIPRHK